MNYEATELKAVEQTAETDVELDILSLSFDDMDLVGGGCTLGNSY